jgi:peroxiredoxin
MVAVGEPAPDFVLRDQTRVKRTLADLVGSRSMVVFMPFAFTNTCLGEMCTLRENLHYLELFIRIVAGRKIRVSNSRSCLTSGRTAQ